jgi:YesN/AraC family two-component response regulator
MNTLLVVEDEKMIRQGIMSIAARSTVPINQIIECKNGQEALEIIRTQVVDVMITDIRMPKMDGITLVREMQQCANIPLTVVVSGYEDFSYAVELLRHGVKEYILKPIERTQMIDILRKLDKEIQDTMEKQHRMVQYGYQQLRYFISSKDIIPSEVAMIREEFENLFLKDNYVVCCTNYDLEVFPDAEGMIYLRNVDKHGVFILEENKLNTLLSTELRNYYVGCSSARKGLQSLKEAYEQALAARKKAFALGEHIIWYSKGNDQYEIIEEQKLNQIVQLLGTSKIAEAIKELNYINYKLKTQKISPDLFCESMRALLSKVASTYKNAISIDDNRVGLFEEIYSYDTASEFYNDLKEWFEKLNGKLQLEFDDYSNKQKIHQAILYINENYKKDLNMAVVSNHISMNYSLFSYAFKQYTGHNFVNYLKDIRIAEAKKLLETTEMLVLEIAQAVGYENEKHFMKTFRSICGVSPSEYRKNSLLGK